MPSATAVEKGAGVSHGELPAPLRSVSKASYIRSLPPRNYSLYPHPLLSLLHGVLTAWWLFSVVLVSSLLVNCLQLLALGLFPLSLCRRMELSQRAASCWWLLFPFATEVWSVIPFILTGDLPLTAGDTALFIGNHAAGLDFPTGVSVSSLRLAPGTGSVMTMLKASLALIPTIGFTHWLQGSLFLRRNWEADQRQISGRMADMREGRFPLPFWIGLYPEGTRLTERKRQESIEFSRQRGLPVFQHVLFPRSKGFLFLLQQLRPTLTALLNATTSYSHRALYLSDPLLRGAFLPEAVHVHLTRTAIARLPAEPAEQSRWLYSAFQEKDELLAYFEQHGHFPAAERKDAIYSEGCGRAHWLTAVFVVWSAVLCLLLAAAAGAFWAAVGVLLTALTVLRPMIVGGLFDVFGGGEGLLGSRQSWRTAKKVK